MRGGGWIVKQTSREFVSWEQGLWCGRGEGTGGRKYGDGWGGGGD